MPLGDDYRFEGEPGLYVHARPIDIAGFRQLTSIDSETTATHSQAKGWIPTVALTLTHVPLENADPALTEQTKLMLPFDVAEGLVDHLLEGLEGARRDAAAGPKEGPHPWKAS